MLYCGHSVHTISAVSSVIYRKVNLTDGQIPFVRISVTFPLSDVCILYRTVIEKNYTNHSVSLLMSIHLRTDEDLSFHFRKRYPVLIRQLWSAGCRSNARHSKIHTDHTVSAFFQLVIMSLRCELLLGVFGCIKRKTFRLFKNQPRAAVAY